MAASAGACGNGRRGRGAARAASVVTHHPASPVLGGHLQVCGIDGEVLVAGGAYLPPALD